MPSSIILINIIDIGTLRVRRQNNQVCVNLKREASLRNAARFFIIRGGV